MDDENNIDINQYIEYDDFEEAMILKVTMVAEEYRTQTNNVYLIATFLFVCTFCV